MHFIDIGALGQQARVVVEPGAAILDVIDKAPFAAAGDLHEPYRCRIIHTQIPRRPDAQARLMRNAGDAALGFGLLHQRAVVSATVWRIEAAAKFLLELGGTHLAFEADDGLRW